LIGIEWLVRGALTRVIQWALTIIDSVNKHWFFKIWMDGLFRVAVIEAKSFSANSSPR
jgi:hypothetical protein